MPPLKVGKLYKYATENIVLILTYNNDVGDNHDIARIKVLNLDGEVRHFNFFEKDLPSIFKLVST